MDFNLRIDPGALVNLDDVKGESVGIQVTDSDLVVNMGSEFGAQINRTAVADAEVISDPRPDVYFPMGLSAAVEKLGRDTICIVTSYSGLVRVDFRQEVQGEGRPVAVRSTGGGGARQVGGYEPPSALQTWARVIGVIVALVLIYEAISHGHFLWVVIAIVLLLLFFIGRSVITSMRERNARRMIVPAERTPIPFRHLIVSVEDPNGLVQALTQRSGAARSAI